MSKESRSTEKMRYKSKIFWSKWFHHSLLSGFSITLMPSRTNAFTMGSVTQILQVSSLSSTGWQSLDLELLWLVSMPIQRPGICGHVQWCHVVSEGLVSTVCTRATIPRKTNIIHIRLMTVYIFATYMFVSCSCCWRGQLNKSWQFQWIFVSQKAKVTHNLQQLTYTRGKTFFEMLVLFNSLVSSLMPRTHPAHTRRKGLVSKVWILWL